MSSDLVERMGRHLNPGLARAFRFMGLTEVERAGHGAWVVTEEGREYLDLAGGYGVHVAGYMHPRLVAAARRQLESGLALSSRVLPSAPAVELAERLEALLPGRMPYSFFVNSGAEAVEAAIKFARLATGRPRLIATHGAYHGKTMGALSVSGRALYQDPVRPLMGGVQHVPYGDAEAVEAALDDQVAAVLVEPIQGEGGVILPPEDYLPRLRRACDRVGALLVVDEVQTGMARTGRFLASQHSGVEPDLVCLAKGLGGGIMPIGAVCGTAGAFAFLDEQPLIHTSTFGGGPLACTVALATLDLIEEEHLAERAARLGAQALERLRRLAAEAPEVLTEVRGRGLMMGLALTSEGAAGMVMAELFTRQVLAVYTLNNERVIRLLPPLVIGEGELDFGLAAVEEAVRATRALAAELAGEATAGA